MSAPVPLTAREQQILELIGRGLTTRRISESLHIEIATVRKHRENLMRKLDLHSTAEILLFTLMKKGDVARRPTPRVGRVFVTRPRRKR